MESDMKVCTKQRCIPPCKKKKKGWYSSVLAKCLWKPNYWYEHRWWAMCFSNGNNKCVINNILNSTVQLLTYEINILLTTDENAVALHVITGFLWSTGKSSSSNTASQTEWRMDNFLWVVFSHFISELDRSNVSGLPLRK